MDITKENDTLVLRLPLRQNSYDALDQLTGQVPSLIGVIAGDQYTISYLVDLGYKDDQQEGMEVITFSSKEELEKACKTLGLDIWDHPVCTHCHKVMRGTIGWGPNGNQCNDCENL